MFDDLFSDMKFEKNDELSVTWEKVQECNMLPILPEGYLYCNECNAFTPHYKYGSYRESKVCEVCTTDKDVDNMCECGYDFGDDHFSRDGKQEVTLHGIGCHCDENYNPNMDNDDVATVSYGFHTCYFNTRHAQNSITINASSYAGMILYQFVII